ncbi:hypothetical protein DL95DRAFT_407634 [Leptodontidium sp. 2 PMI_412]|nr:hypothetical protein DL95DRAFT_407634 [Leptodontidium sp. 2 PMI_412]
MNPPQLLLFPSSVNNTSLTQARSSKARKPKTINSQSSNYNHQATSRRKLLNFIVLSLTNLLLSATSIATPTNLHSRGQPYYCIPSARFTLGYQICTFASLIDPSFNSHLWLFDSQCGIVGTASNIPLSTLPTSSGPGSHTYDFKSRLRYVAVTDLRDGQSPVVMKYAGKTWGGKKEQCWVDDNSWWVCTFEFNCEAVKAMGIESLSVGDVGDAGGAVQNPQLGTLPFGNGEEGILGVI